MIVSQIVKQWLQEHGYDGLVQEDGECACMVSCLAPCCELGKDCKAGVLGRCNAETCASGGGCKWHIVERGHEDQMTEEERATFLKRHHANADLADALNKRFDADEKK